MEINQKYVRERQVKIEGVQSSSEHTLPDYQGDVKKVLYSSAEAQDGGKYQGRDMLECVGAVVYKIVYLDADGRITPVSFTSDYEMSTRCPDEGYIDADVHTRVTNFSLRLMGPRRFSVKAQLEADVTLCENADYTLEGEHSMTDLEVQKKNVEVATGCYKTSAEREMAEELVHLEGAIVDEVEVLLCSVEPRGVTAQRVSDGVDVKAQMCVRALISTMGEAPRSYECEVDFSERVEIDLPESAIPLARVPVISERVSLNPLDDGVSVVVNLIAEASVSAHYNGEISVVKDCYSTERSTELQEGEFPYTEFIGSAIVNEKYSYTLPRETVGAESVRNVLFESARPRIEEVSSDGGKLEISGMLQFSAIACEVSEDGAPGYTPLRFEAPFAVNVNINSQIPDNFKKKIALNFDSAHIELDGNNVNCSGTLSGAASVYADKREPCIISASLGEEIFDCSGSTVSVYYPGYGESLFDVAKRFHTTTIMLAKDNELTEAVFSMQNSSDGLSGIEYLVINKWDK